MDPNLGSERWIIFCRVIDNLGDAGVCWRLAQQLADEHQLDVELVIDRPELLPPFGHNNPSANKIQITQWNEQLKCKLADVTLSTFSCEIPIAYRQQLQAARNAGALTKKNYWFNLEYLSAHKWVEGVQLFSSTKPSINQDLSLTEVFFYPGFTGKTGGLLHEKFLTNTCAENLSKRKQWAIAKDSLAVSLFCYANAQINALIESLIEYSSTHSVHLLVTAGLAISPMLQAQLNSRPNFKIEFLPFLTQRDYDHLLGACDINFVRGEDSLVRAIWAKRPFVWQAYPQDEGTQLDKVAALIDQLSLCELNTANSRINNAQLRALFFAWNFPNSSTPNGFQAFFTHSLAELEDWEAQVSYFCDRLCQQPDLASQLVAASV